MRDGPRRAMSPSNSRASPQYDCGIERACESFGVSCSSVRASAVFCCRPFALGVEERFSQQPPAQNRMVSFIDAVQGEDMLGCVVGDALDLHSSLVCAVKTKHAGTRCGGAVHPNTTVNAVESAVLADKRDQAVAGPLKAQAAGRVTERQRPPGDALERRWVVVSSQSSTIRSSSVWLSTAMARFRVTSGRL